MRTAIFIRSYHGDFKWLRYCLASIKKYAFEFTEVCLVVPISSKRALKTSKLITDEKVFYCRDYANDYLGQQVTKLDAWRYTDCERILFIDSDTVFITGVLPDYFLKGSKIWMYKTPYREDLIGQAMCWKSRTEEAVGFPVEFEYMRRFPLMYWRSTLEAAVKYVEAIHGDLEKYIISKPGNDFSEFNLIGAYAERFEVDKYLFIDTTKEPLVPTVAKQYWSWGGITPTISEELQNL